MANYYRVAYKESQNTLKQICELFRVDSSDITIKFVVAVMGPLVFYFMCKYGNPGGGTPGGMTFFVIKFIVVWALAFVVAVILNRTIWRKVLSTTAVGDAEEQFDRRCRLNGGPVSSEIHFFSLHIPASFQKKFCQFVRIVSFQCSLWKSDHRSRRSDRLGICLHNYTECLFRLQDLGNIFVRK